MYLVIYSLGSYDHQFARVAYQNKEDAEKFKDDLLADGCKAIVRKVTEPAELAAYHL